MPRPSLLRLHPSASRAEAWLGAALLALCVVLTPWWGAEGPLEQTLLQAALPRPLDAPAVTAITIEDTDLDRLGPWPWPRDRHAALIDRLVESGARTIVYLVAFSGPDPTSRGLGELRTLRGLLGPVPEQAEGLAGALSHALTRAERALDTDTRLADSLRRADRVLLLCEPAGGAAGLRPPPAAWRLEGAGMTPPTTACRPPLAPLGEAALAVGRVALAPSTSAPWTLQAFAAAGSQVAPSLPLAALWHAQDVTRAPIATPSAWGGAIVQAGDLPVRADGRGAVRLLGPQAGGADGVAVLPWARGMADRMAMAALRGQIVVVGPAQAGVLGPVAAPAVAQAVAALGHGRTFAGLIPNMPPPLFLFALTAIYLIVIAPRLATPWAVGMSVGLAFLLLVAEWGLLRLQALWLPLVQPACLMGAAALAWALCRWRRVPVAVPEAMPEAQWLHGLALQSRGQLAAAYRQFKALPAAPATLECLLGLAQQCEQQGEGALAHRVYQHLLRRVRTHAQAQAGYRRTRAAAGAPAAVAAGAVPVPEPSSPPQAAVTALGRYQIEQALGQGAMGVVYRGHDPTIGRVVAIKTLALGQEFEGEGLVQARERFFREAETAGRLQHPHIVTIFDAGEAHGLAYIAMEFLQGHDLSAATQPGTLMPVAQVLSIAARVAQALDYAHAHQVVHRDIKPANIMFDAATDTVKVTDFGIARITDSNRTRTGLVLGTPSFMAPEQLAGRRVDGRCDLYALGVTLFQWLTGNLPLRGNSMGALMQQIAHAAAPDVRTLRPELPADVAALVACALQKSPAERFQTGLQMAEALRRALDHLPDAMGHRDVERVVYDAPRDATGQDMAQLQGTVVDISSPRGVDSGRPAGAA